MEEKEYKLEEFKSFLLANNILENEVPRFLNAIMDFIQFLEEKNETMLSFSYGKLIEYADILASMDREEAEYLVRGLWRYFPFIKKYHHIEELLDIAESASAMETLYERVAKWHGEAIQTEIFKDIEIPPLGAHPEKKPQVTRVILKKLEENLGEEKTQELLRPCLHGGQFVGTDKEKFHELKDLDQFLKIKYLDLIKEVLDNFFGLSEILAGR